MERICLEEVPWFPMLGGVPKGYQCKSSPFYSCQPLPCPTIVPVYLFERLYSHRSVQLSNNKVNFGLENKKLLALKQKIFTSD